MCRASGLIYRPVERKVPIPIHMTWRRERINRRAQTRHRGAEYMQGYSLRTRRRHVDGSQPPLETPPLKHRQRSADGVRVPISTQPGQILRKTVLDSFAYTRVRKIRAPCANSIRDRAPYLKRRLSQIIVHFQGSRPICTAGRVQGLIDDIPTMQEFLYDIISDAESILPGRLNGMII